MDKSVLFKDVKFVKQYFEKQGKIVTIEHNCFRDEDTNKELVIKIEHIDDKNVKLITGKFKFLS